MPMPVDYTLPVASAQVKSAILLAGLNTPGTTRAVEPVLTRDHTELMLRHFGLDVRQSSDENNANVISLDGHQDLKPANLHIPRDPSAAAFAAVAALITQGSEITIPGLCLNARRTGLYAALADMGADITYHNRDVEAGEDVGDLEVRHTPGLKGVHVTPERVPDMIDEIPVLCVAAAFANGTTHIAGLGELRHKESDRVTTTSDMLTACGVRVEAGEDSLTIHGDGTPPAGGAEIDSHGDHRIAMAAAVLGLGARKGVTVTNAGAIATSFPDFAQMMTTLGAAIEEKYD
jgi:3-phosphoshikimate 1-carboxyvinyltransferase